MSSRRIEISAIVTQPKQDEKAILLFYEWASQQNRLGWQQYGSFITISEEHRIIFTYVIAGDFDLSIDQVDTLIRLLKDSGMSAPMTLFDPRPASP